MNLGMIITRESLLATEELMEKTIQAEAGTPQAYDNFIEGSEQEAIKEREDPETADDFGADTSGVDGVNDDNQDPTADMGDQGEATANEAEDPADNNGDGNEAGQTDTQTVSEVADPLADSVADEASPTNESLNEWIKDKTSTSTSGFVRGTGTVLAGLVYLGLSYGPGILASMFKGVIWVFSRVGTLLFESGKALAAFIEKSNNSISKLEARLDAAQSILVEKLNEGEQLPSFSYKDKRVIDYLRIGDGVDIDSNIRSFATSLTASTASIASEFEAGVSLIEKISSSDPSRIGSLRPIMEVSVPKGGFKQGVIPGYQSKSDLVRQYHTTPMWPGDAALIFNRPLIQSDDIKEITDSYSKADMFVGINKSLSGSIESIPSFNGQQALSYAKSIRILLASMKEVSGSQKRMHSLGPKIALKAKQMFIRLADDKAKVSMKDTLVEPLYLRTSMAESVFVNGSKACMVHASRVAAAAVTLLEAHASRIATSTE